jgi:hypothetical protein
VIEDKPDAKKKRGPGRPEFVPTAEQRQQVFELSGAGVPQDLICESLGFHLETLRKYFRRELARAKIEKGLKAGNILFAKAMGGDTVALIFWLKTQMRWSEKHDQNKPEETGDNSFTWQNPQEQKQP